MKKLAILLNVGLGLHVTYENLENNLQLLHWLYIPW